MLTRDDPFPGHSEVVRRPPINAPAHRPRRPVIGHRDQVPSVVYLITSSGAWWGGAERQVHHLARTFARRGWDVGVVTMMPMDSSLRELMADGVKVASLGMRRAIPDPRGVLRLRALLGRWHPDIVHGHMVHASLLARVTRLLVSVPAVISTIHNEDEGRQWRYLAYRITDPLSDRTTAVSQVAVDAAVRRGAAPKGTILKVVNGIGTEAYRSDPQARVKTRRALGLSERFTWLAVGRLTEAKAYPDMIAAFQRAQSDCPDARLVIAGIGPLRELVESRVREARLQDSVALLGLRSDVPALMQAADAFVMSSAWEGLPMVLLEAGASSLPIVATDVGGSREAVLDGSSGFVVPPGDIEALADAMRHVMALTRSGRRSIGHAGRRHVSDKFDLEVVADTWEGIYRDALRGR